MSAQRTGRGSNITGSAVVVTGRGHMLGFYVNSTSSGTIAFYDTAAADTANAITGTITPAIGWHALPVEFGNGLRAVIASTLNVTIVHGNG